MADVEFQAFSPADASQVLDRAAAVVRLMIAGQHSGAARRKLEVCLEEIAKPLIPKDPLRVELDPKFSALKYGVSRLDNRVTEWLAATGLPHRKEVRESYGSAMHMDSGSDPYRDYTFIFNTPEDAQRFEAAMKAEFVIPDHHA
jgi:hypothetical protein